MSHTPVPEPHTHTHVEVVMPRWLALILGAVICIVIALVLAPYIPEPGAQLVAIVAWIGAAVCAVVAGVELVRGGAGTTP